MMIYLHTSLIGVHIEHLHVQPLCDLHFISHSKLESINKWHVLSALFTYMCTRRYAPGKFQGSLGIALEVK